MERSKLLLPVIWVWFLSAFQLNAQDHRFMTFFHDKNSSFSIDNPAEFLSTRAIERRTKQGIDITEEDLPVNTSYITSIEDLGVTVWYATKWLNGALIQTDSSRLVEITALPFVSSIEFVAPDGLKSEISPIFP